MITKKRAIEALYSITPQSCTEWKLATRNLWISKLMHSQETYITNAQLNDLVYDFPMPFSELKRLSLLGRLDQAEPLV